MSFENRILTNFRYILTIRKSEIKLKKLTIIFFKFPLNGFSKLFTSVFALKAA